MPMPMPMPIGSNSPSAKPLLHVIAPLQVSLVSRSHVASISDPDGGMACLGARGNEHAYPIGPRRGERASQPHERAGAGGIAVRARRLHARISTVRQEMQVRRDLIAFRAEAETRVPPDRWGAAHGGTRACGESAVPTV